MSRIIVNAIGYISTKDNLVSFLLSMGYYLKGFLDFSGYNIYIVNNGGRLSHRGISLVLGFDFTLLWENV